MEGKDLILNDCREWEILENFSKKFPYGLSAIFFQTLIIESIISIDLSIFMISSEKSNTISMFDLEDKDI